jgi:hypothetical protein
MGIAFGARLLLLALRLHPIISSRHAIVVDAIPFPTPRTSTMTTPTNDARAFERGRGGDRRPGRRRPTGGGVHHRAIAGGTSRALAQAMLYPLDALRTLSQTRDGRTLADVGYRSLLNGCFQTSVLALFTGAFQFGLRGLLEPHLGPLVSSAFGAAGSCLVSVPQEVVKQRLVSGVYPDFRTALSEIWRTGGGVRGFYSGGWPTMIRNVPFVVATFASRDALRDGVARYKVRRRRHRRGGGDGVRDDDAGRTRGDDDGAADPPPPPRGVVFPDEDDDRRGGRRHRHRLRPDIVPPDPANGRRQDANDDAGRVECRAVFERLGMRIFHTQNGGLEEAVQRRGSEGLVHGRPMGHDLRDGAGVDRIFDRTGGGEGTWN